jgi:hypothetical protein
MPWWEKTTQPYVRALRGWKDVTKDAAHEPQAAQFRTDWRSLERGMIARMPERLGTATAYGVAGSRARNPCGESPRNVAVQRVEDRPSRRKEFDDPEISRRSTTANRNHFRRTSQPLWPSKSGTFSATSGGSSAHLADRPRRAVHVLTDGQGLETRCFAACPGAENTTSNRAEMPNQKQSGEKK